MGGRALQVVRSVIPVLYAVDALKFLGIDGELEQWPSTRLSALPCRVENHILRILPVGRVAVGTQPQLDTRSEERVLPELTLLIAANAIADGVGVAGTGAQTAVVTDVSDLVLFATPWQEWEGEIVPELVATTELAELLAVHFPVVIEGAERTELVG